MLLILLSWIYLFFIAFVIGVSAARLFSIQATDKVITVFIGFFSITVLIGFWCIFAPVNEMLYLAVFILSVVLFFKNKNDVKNKLNQFKSSFLGLKPIFKAFICILMLLLLAKCASAPFLVDNETYYIQTIKWLNHHGFTKGLTNLHLFLGQTSGWHILQSGFNFAFIYDNLNDLSGFCLFLGNFYAIEKLNKYNEQTHKNKIDLIIGLFSVFNVFLFQFIGAPSPDIAIYVISIIIFYEFVRCYKEYNMHSFYAVFILSVFATFIKLTGIVFFVFALILYFHYYIYTRRETKKMLIVSCITFALFAIKNTIITGNILYPLNIEALQTEWSLPNAVNDYFSKYEKAASYGLSIETYENASIFKRITSWITQSKLDGLFNTLMLLLVAIIPFFVRKVKPLKLIYFTGIGFHFFLFFVSPQYRFYFPFLMLFSLLIASAVFINKKVIYTLMSICLLLPVIPMVYNINTYELTNTKEHQTANTFSLSYIIEPHNNSKHNTSFEVIKLENHTINSPLAIDFIWATGDIPLPAVNEKQLDYLGTYFNITPQQISNDLGDGFISKPLLDD